MSARLPAGTIKERADGGVWLKPSSTAKEWKQLSAGTGAAGAKPAAPGIPEAEPLQDVNGGWLAAQEQYQLDGHLPPPEVHPQNAEIDAEGDIDSKPVIKWKSAEGRDRRTYTQRFHWNRFAGIHEVSKGSYESIPQNFANLEAAFDGEGGEAAMAAYVHLKTGQPIAAVSGMHAQHGHVAREVAPKKVEAVEKGARTSLLTKILHASIALRDRTQFFHWNVVGPNFPALHQLFEKQYDALGEAVDDIAERIRALGEVVQEVAKEERPMPASPEAMLAELAASHERLSDLCEEAVGQAEADRDAATVDLLGKRCVEHDKAAWMLRVTGGVEDDCECKGCDDCSDDDDDETVAKGAEGAPEEYNKPRRIRQGEPGYGKKKFVVNARNAQGKTRVIRFGDAKMEIKRDDPERRSNFRARHNCASAKDILSARYWSCKQWRSKEKVAKGGSTSDKFHPDRAHFLLTHAKGHAYTTSVHHPKIANHVHTRKQDGEGPLFNTTPEAVTGALEKAGFGAVDPRVVEHHTIASMAADFLSKTPSSVLRKGGVGAARLHLTACSDHIAEHYGHDPAPRGMSYVPPDIAAAYLEDLGAAAQYPTAYAGLKGESHRNTAERAVVKAFGTLEGHEDDVETITARLVRADKRLHKGDPCSLLEVETFLGLPPATASRELAKSNSTKPTEEPKSTTPSPSSESSEPSTKAPALELDQGLEKGESYLARLAPGSGERRARYVYDRDVLKTLLSYDSSTNAFLPGTRFAMALPGSSGEAVPGYFDIDDRISVLVTARHTGTGKTFRVNVEDLRKLLHAYHCTHEPAKQPGLKEMPEVEVGPVTKSHTLFEADKPTLGPVLSDIGSRKPEHQMAEDLAKDVYLRMTEKYKAGEVDFDTFKAITVAMLDRNYPLMASLCKGVATTGSDVGKPSSTASAGSGAGASAGVGHRGPAGLPVGAQTQRKDGTYKKEGDHKWARVSDHHRDKKSPDAHASGSHDSATLEGLRSRLSKLRTALRAAGDTKARNKIISEITAIKSRIKKLNLAQHGKSEATQKAQENLRDMTDSLDYIDDPIEQWLAKAQSERLKALDAFILEVDGDYFDFGAELAYAEPVVKAQAHQLRLSEGADALRNRFLLVKAKVR